MTRKFCQEDAQQDQERCFKRFPLGTPISETEEIYRTADGKFRIHLGLFQKNTDETVWLKFVHKSLMASSSTGLAIAVENFTSFTEFLSASRQAAESDLGDTCRIPFFPRIVLRIQEGVYEAKLLGEHHHPDDHKIVTRLYSYRNRHAFPRILFGYKNSGQDTYEAFDVEVLNLFENEVMNRSKATGQDIVPNG